MRVHPPLANVGHDDLGPNISGPGGFGSNGSLVGPNHPMFRGRNNGVDFPQYGGRMPPGVPPNARFDPFGPSVSRGLAHIVVVEAEVTSVVVCQTMII